MNTAIIGALIVPAITAAMPISAKFAVGRETPYAFAVVANR